MKKRYYAFAGIVGAVVGAVAVAAFSYFKSVNWCSVDWNVIGAFGTVLAVGIAAITYIDTVGRESKLETIREFSRIRSQFSDLGSASDKERTEYLKEMERFCTGINLGLYDINTLITMAGSMLTTQYNDYMKDLIENKREHARNAKPEKIYSEYESFIKKVSRNKGK